MPDPETTAYDKANAAARIATERCAEPMFTGATDVVKQTDITGMTATELAALGTGAMAKPPQELLKDERGSVYGPWEPNMRGTSMQLAGLLIQYQSCNPEMRGLPSWWTPLSEITLKMNRIASGIYHEDHFRDIRNYLDFLQEMQQNDRST